MGYKTIEQKRMYQREWMRKRRAAVINDLGGKCVQCGQTDNLEIDHIDPDTKAIEISQVLSFALDNPIRIVELAKCQLLCTECHKQKTIIHVRVEHGINGYRRGCRCSVCYKAKQIEKARYLERRRQLKLKT